MAAQSELSRDPDIPTDLVQVGRLTGAYGVHGWLRVEAFGQSESILPAQNGCWIDRPDRRQRTDEIDSSTLRWLAIAQWRPQGSDLIARTDAVPDREAANDLKGSRVWISRAQFPAPADDEFYWIDLIGCEVINLQQVLLGIVTQIEDHGADPVLQVTASDSRQVRLIPFVDQYLGEVDLTARRIEVDWDPAWDQPDAD